MFRFINIKKLKNSLMVQNNNLQQVGNFSEKNLSNNSPRKYNKLSEILKNSIVQKTEEGYSIGQISNFHNIPKSTIHSFLKTKTVNNIEKKKGRPSLLTEEILSLIELSIENKNTLTLKELKRLIFESKQVSLSPTTIFRALNFLKLTRKRVQTVPIERNSVQTKNKRFDFAFYMLPYVNSDPFKIIYLDESGFNCHLTRNYGRSISGTSPISLVPASPGKNLSLIQIISIEKVIYFEIYEGAINANIFKAFLQQALLRISPDSILIMDNARIHHANIVQDFVAESSLKTLFLPPYSPF